MPDWLVGVLAVIGAIFGTGGAASLYLGWRSRGREPLERANLAVAASLVEAQAQTEAEIATDRRYDRWEKEWARQAIQLEDLEKRNNALEVRVEGLESRNEDLAADLDVSQRDNRRLRVGLKVSVAFVEALFPLVPDPKPPRPDNWDAIHRLTQE